MNGESKYSISDRIIYAGVVFLPMARWFADRIVFSRTGALEWVKTPVNLGLILMLVLIIVQIFPLPASPVAFMSPRTFADKMKLFDF